MTDTAQIIDTLSEDDLFFLVRYENGRESSYTAHEPLTTSGLITIRPTGKVFPPSFISLTSKGLDIMPQVRERLASRNKRMQANFETSEKENKMRDAAPELLECVVDALEDLDVSCSASEEKAKKYRAAIAKATGGAV
jgi:hypothetical protein